MPLLNDPTSGRQTIAPNWFAQQQLQQQMQQMQMQEFASKLARDKAQTGLYNAQAQEAITPKRIDPMDLLIQRAMQGDASALNMIQSIKTAQRGITTLEENQLKANTEESQVSAEAKRNPKSAPISDLETIKTQSEINKLNTEIELLKNPQVKPISLLEEQEARARIGKLEAESDALKNKAPDTRNVDGSLFQWDGKKWQDLGIKGSPNTASKLQSATGLRKEFNDLNKTFVIVREGYEKIKAATKAPSAVGDLTIIFAYMKMIDPGSVVRESEQATAESARGVPAAIRNMYNKMLSGEKLPPAQREDFIKQSQNVYSTMEILSKNTEKKYKELARLYGVDPKLVFGEGLDVLDNNTEEKERKELEELRKLKGSK